MKNQVMVTCPMVPISLNVLDHLIVLNYFFSKDTLTLLMFKIWKFLKILANHTKNGENNCCMVLNNSSLTFAIFALCGKQHNTNV